MIFPAIPTAQPAFSNMMACSCHDVRDEGLHGRGCPEQRPILASHGLLLLHVKVHDAMKLLGWDQNACEKLLSDFEFMAKLAEEGKIIQGMFVATKKRFVRPSFERSGHLGPWILRKPPVAILKIPLKCLETWSVSSLVWERGTRFKSDSARSLTEPDACRFLAA